MHENRPKKLNGSVSPQDLQKYCEKAPNTPITRPSITPTQNGFSDKQPSPKKLNGYIFVVERARAGPGPGPARPGPQWGYPARGRGCPGHGTGANPAQSSSARCTWPTSVVCPSAVAGVAGCPSGVPPQDVLIFNMAATLEK